MTTRNEVCTKECVKRESNYTSTSFFNNANSFCVTMRVLAALTCG